ncbi:retrovirus-related Pol polyprotein from type-1 retrotransposable element R2 [Trichonephila clavipes]|nr:retrovirus-related Pol polyprotein from type-1 retrotransposable element R2 [Trichonephila clavipes]
MVRLRTCPICTYKAVSLTALKHHLVRHNGSLDRIRALRAITKQLNATSTPVARSQAGSEPSPLHDKFRELFPAEFESSSSSSPEQGSSEPNEVKITTVASSPKVKAGNCSPPTTIDALASQLEAIFSPSKKVKIESALSPSPPLCPIANRTTYHGRPPARKAADQSPSSGSKPQEVLDLQKEWTITGPPSSPPFPMDYAGRTKKNLHKCPKCPLAFYTLSKFQEHRVEEDRLESLISENEASNNGNDPPADSSRPGSKRAPETGRRSQWRSRRPKKTMKQGRAEDQGNGGAPDKKTLVGYYTKEGPLESQWCSQCNREFLLGISLAQHIKKCHNVAVCKRNEGPSHTDVIRVDPSDVVDASQAKLDNATTVQVVQPKVQSFVCSFCEKGFHTEDELDNHVLTLHGQEKTMKTTPERKPKRSQKSSPPYKRTCHICGLICSSAKGLKVHLQQAHQKIVQKRERILCSQDEELVQATTDNRSPDPQPVPTPGTEEAITGDERTSVIDNITAGPSNSWNSPAPNFRNNDVQLLGQTVRFTFPVHKVLPCPTDYCPHSFTAKKWHTTKASIMRHLRWFHRMKNPTAEHWCGICQSRIHNQPATHPCLRHGLFLKPMFKTKSDWECQECDFVATSQLGLRNHAVTHKRGQLEDKGTPINILPGPKQRKRNRQKKLGPLSSGEPGDLQLAPVTTESTAQSQGISQSQQQESDSSKIDIQRPTVLDSFREPLNTILNMDELEERKLLFNQLTNDITEAVQSHFNLSRPPTSSQSSTRPNCAIPKERVQAHFKEIWETPAGPTEFPELPPPASSPESSQRPPVLEFISPKVVAACLKSAENSAPGPDLISYKHWREIDPTCTILAKLFQICLKIADIPDAWKESNTILIHKGDSPDELEN